MMKQSGKIRSILFKIILLAAFSIGLTACGAEEEIPTEKAVGEVVFLDGTVNVLNSGTGEIVPAEMQTELRVNDRIAVERDSLMRFDLEAGTLVYALPLTVFNIEDETPDKDDPTPLIDLETGQMWVLQAKGSITVKTPLGDASARQAHMRISFSTDQSEGVSIDCLSGTCEFSTLVETFSIEAGESIRLSTTSSPEFVKQVQDDTVEEWLAIHPVATMLLPELSKTPTPPIPETPEIIISGTVCPIPSGWQSMLVAEGQSLESIAQAYKIDKAELAQGSCLAEDAELFAGMVLYVPVIRRSLTPTQTNTLTPTITQTPTVTQTPTRTASPTMASPTPKANENAVFDIQTAPVTTISSCDVTFRVKVTDPEQVGSVKVQVSLNDASFGAGHLIILSPIGNDVYESTSIIDTSAPGNDLVYWRLLATDLQNNTQFFPQTPSYYYYTDTHDCTLNTPTPTRTTVVVHTPTATQTPTVQGEDTPTPVIVVPTPDGSETATPTSTSTPTATEDITNAVFTNPIGPAGVAIVNCANTYSVEVTDPNGIDTVSVQYAVNDATLSHYVIAPLSHQGANLYGDILQFETSAEGNDLVFWRFRLVDGSGNSEFFPSIPNSYTDALDCPAP